MSFSRPTPNAFLAELMRRTKGDLQAKISMYDTGAALGLEKAEAGKLAEEVIAQGWAEIKTLSGDIGITSEGIAASGTDGSENSSTSTPSMGKGPIVQDADRIVVERVLERIQNELVDMSLPYDTLEEIVMDLKTTRVQLLSPKPKTAIIIAALNSLKSALGAAGATDTAAQIQALVQESTTV